VRGGRDGQEHVHQQVPASGGGPDGQKRHHRVHHPGRTRLGTQVLDHGRQHPHPRVRPARLLHQQLQERRLHQELRPALVRRGPPDDARALLGGGQDDRQAPGGDARALAVRQDLLPQRRGVHGQADGAGPEDRARSGGPGRGHRDRPDAREGERAAARRAALVLHRQLQGLLRLVAPHRRHPGESAALPVAQLRRGVREAVYCLFECRNQH